MQALFHIATRKKGCHKQLIMAVCVRMTAEIEAVRAAASAASGWMEEDASMCSPSCCMGRPCDSHGSSPAHGVH